MRYKQSLLNFLPYGALFFVYLAWGTTFGSIRIGLTYLPPDVLVVWRFALGAMMLFALSGVFAVTLKLPIEVTLERTKTNVITGLLIFAIGNGLLCWPLSYLSSGMAAGVLAFCPFLLLGLSRWFPPHEQLTRPVALALGLGVIGMGVLVVGYDQAQQVSQGGITVMQWVSIGLMFVVNACWSVGSLIVRRQQQSLPQLCFDTACQCLCAVGVFSALAIFSGHQLWLGEYPLSVTWAVLYLSVVGTCLGMLCYVYALKNLPIALTGSFAYVTPMLTMVLGAWLLHEPIAPLMWVGLGLILMSVIAVHRVTRQARAEQVRLNQVQAQRNCPEAHLDQSTSVKAQPILSH
jgi:drug/metabolite transporter (DMT)-like permease